MNGYPTSRQQQRRVKTARTAWINLSQKALVWANSYHDLADQIKDRKLTETIDNKLSGFYRFCIGLAKKVIIANSIGKYADDVFNTNISELDSSSAWIGMVAYTFQIYFDFSGYSDMAIGLGKIMGFIFPENFDHPYTSQSITG